MEISGEIATAPRGENLRGKIDFLLDFADTLMAAGTQTSRVVRNVERLADNFGCRADIIILPRTIIMTVSAGDFSLTRVKKVSPHAPDFRIISELRILSWEAYKNGMTLDECKSRFDEIKKQKPISWKIKAPIVAIGNAAFCQLFGGFYSVPLVFFTTLAGWLARFALQRRNAPEHLCCIVAAFVSSLLAGIVANIFGFKTDIAISTSILYLVPGVPLLNAFIDMFDGHILAGFSRLVKASETILAMTLGLLGAILILGRAIL